MSSIKRWATGDGVFMFDLWKRVLVSKYGGWRALENKGVDRKSSIWWRDLGKVRRGKNENKWFDKCLEWKVGVGIR